MNVDPEVICPLITARRVPLVRSFIYRRTCVNHSSICPWDVISLIYVDDPSRADALLAKDMGIATSWQKLEQSVMVKYPPPPWQLKSHRREEAIRKDRQGLSTEVDSLKEGSLKQLGGRASPSPLLLPAYT